MKKIVLLALLSILTSTSFTLAQPAEEGVVAGMHVAPSPVLPAPSPPRHATDSAPAATTPKLSLEERLRQLSGAAPNPAPTPAPLAPAATAPVAAPVPVSTQAETPSSHQTAVCPPVQHRAKRRFRRVIAHHIERPQTAALPTYYMPGPPTYAVAPYTPTNGTILVPETPQYCFAGTYICPLTNTRLGVAASCSCPARDGGSVWGNTYQP